MTLGLEKQLLSMLLKDSQIQDSASRHPHEGWWFGAKCGFLPRNELNMELGRSDEELG